MSTKKKDENLKKISLGSFDRKNDKLTFDEEFKQSHDKESNKGYIHQANFKYCKELNEKDSGFLFLLKRMKID